MIYLLLNYFDNMQALTTLTSIDHTTFTLSLNLVWAVSWLDQRINTSKIISPFVQLSPEIQAKLWTPMMDVYPMKNVKKTSPIFGEETFRPGDTLRFYSV